MLSENWEAEMIDEVAELLSIAMLEQSANA